MFLILILYLYGPKETFLLWPFGPSLKLYLYLYHWRSATYIGLLCACARSCSVMRPIMRNINISVRATVHAFTLPPLTCWSTQYFQFQLLSIGNNVFTGRLTIFPVAPNLIFTVRIFPSRRPAVPSFH